MQLVLFPGKSWNVPASHAIHAGVVVTVQAPAMYDPTPHCAVHGAQADCPVLGWKDPAVHALHDVRLPAAL